jgi:hypothetical protein
VHDDDIFADGGYTLNNSKPVGATSDQLEALRHCPPPELDEANDPTPASEASLDLLTAGAGVPVIPLAAGKVLVADEVCHLVIVDHSTVSNGVWVAYLHFDVSVHMGPVSDARHAARCHRSAAYLLV